MALHEGLRPQLSGLARNGPPSGCHPGVWLDHFLPEQTWHQSREPAGYDKDQVRGAKDEMVRQIEGLRLADGYRRALSLWRQGLAAEGARIVTADGTSLGRVIIGIGQKGPAEFGITLHHTWGVPVLPGSSLKGIAAVGADRYLEGEQWRRRDDSATARKAGPNAFDALFGDVEEQGAVIFHDAWFVPGADEHNGLHHDVLTVHHPGYYQKGEAPSDTESPIPVPFVSAKGAFLVALGLNPSLDPARHGHWLEAAWTALREGLRHHGVGAKTNAGYGRIDLPVFTETSIGMEMAAETARRAAAAAAAAEIVAREQRQQRREAMPEAGQRLEDVLANEGAPALLAWLKRGGATDLAGLRFDQEHVMAAAAALLAARLGAGVVQTLDQPAKGWWQAYLNAPVAARPAPPPANLKHWSDGELSEQLAPFIKKNDWNGASASFEKARLDADTLQRAIDLLESQEGCKPGHTRRLKEGLERLKPRSS